MEDSIIDDGIKRQVAASSKDNDYSDIDAFLGEDPKAAEKAQLREAKIQSAQEKIDFDVPFAGAPDGQTPEEEPASPIQSSETLPTKKQAAPAKPVAKKEEPGSVGGAAIQAVGGALDTAQSVVNLGILAAQKIDSTLGKDYVNDNYRATFAKDMIHESNNKYERFARSLGQVGTALYMASKVSPALIGPIAGSKGKAALVGAAVDFIGFEGNSGRIADAFHEWGWTWVTIDALRTKPGEKDSFEGRFKNAVEGAGIGALASVAFSVGKFLFARKAAKDVLESTEKAVPPGGPPSAPTTPIKEEELTIGGEFIADEVKEAVPVPKMGQEEAAKLHQEFDKDLDTFLDPEISFSGEGHSVRKNALGSKLGRIEEFVDNESLRTPESIKAVSSMTTKMKAILKRLDNESPAANKSEKSYQTRTLNRIEAIEEKIHAQPGAQKVEKKVVVDKTVKEYGPVSSHTDKTGARVHEVDFTKIKNTTKLEKIVNEFAQSEHGNFAGNMTHEQSLEELAKATGRSVESLKASTAMNFGDQRTVQATTHLINAAAEEVHSLANKAGELRGSGKASVSSQLQADVSVLEGMNTYLGIIEHIAGEGSAKLKGIDWERIKGVESADPAILSRQENNLKDYIRIFGGSKKAQAAIAQLKSLPPDKLPMVAEKAKLTSTGEAIMETFINSKLWSVSTHIANIVSGFVTASTDIAAKSFGKYLHKSLEIDPKLAREQFQWAMAAKERYLKAARVVLDEKLLAKLKGESDKADEILTWHSKSGIYSKEILGEVPAGFKGAWDAIKASQASFMDTVYLLRQAAKEGNFTKTLRNVSKESYSQGKFTTGGGPAVASNASGPIGTAIDILGAINRIPTTALGLEDEIVKAANYRQEIHSVAIRLSEKANLVGKEREDFMKQFMANPPPEIRMQGKARGERNTFQNELDGIAANFGDLLNFKVAGIQPFKLAVAFFRTPMNITSYSLKNNWMTGPMFDSYSAVMRSGNVSEIQLMKGRMSLGSGLMGALSGMYFAGKITGDSPADRTLRKNQLDSGWKPYSFVTKGKDGIDTYTPLAKVEPLGSLVRFSGNLGDLVSSIGKEWDEQEAMDFITLAIHTITEAYTPEMLMDSLGDIIDLMDNKGGRLQKAAQLAVDITPIPFGATNVVRKIYDPLRRDTSVDAQDKMGFIHLYLNEIRNRVPGLSDNLPANQNIFGDDVTYKLGLGSDVINPFISTDFNSKDVTMNEIIRLGYAGHLGSPTAPGGATYLRIGMPERYLTIGNPGVTVDLTPEQYYRYVKLSAGKGIDKNGVAESLEHLDKYAVNPSVPRAWIKNLAGKTLKQSLDELIKSNYSHFGTAKLSFPEKFKTDEFKRGQIKLMVDVYRSVAQAQMFVDDPQMADRAAQGLSDKLKLKDSTIKPEKYQKIYKDHGDKIRIRGNR